MLQPTAVRQSTHSVEPPRCLLHLNSLKHKGCLLFVGLIDLVSQQLTAGPCQGFRRPTAPSDILVTDVPAMAAFAKAALDGGIEHESVQGLYQAGILPSLGTAISQFLESLTQSECCIQAIRPNIISCVSSWQYSFC